jgi:hypothetical protein
MLYSMYVSLNSMIQNTILMSRLSPSKTPADLSSAGCEFRSRLFHANCCNLFISMVEYVSRHFYDSVNLRESLLFTDIVLS